MTRIAPLALSLVMVVGVVAWVPLPGLGAGTAQTDETNVTAAPGERLAGVVGVQGAAIDGEIARRAFAHRLASATTNASKAAVIAEKYDSLQSQRGALADRRAELLEAHRNGTLSDGEYQARMATVHAQSETVQNLANRTAMASAGLPAGALEAKGVNATAIQTLRADAAALTGPETAAVARSIAGPSAGERPVENGGAPVAASQTRSNSDRIGNASTVDRGPDRNATDASESGGGADGAGTNGAGGQDGSGSEEGPQGRLAAVVERVH